jgi:hypothetical protein
MRLAIRHPSAMTASSHAANTTTVDAVLPGANSRRSAATRITGQSSVTATVRHGTYALRSGPRCAQNARTMGRAISDHRAPADGDCAELELYRPVR